MRIHSLTTRFLLTLLLATALPFLVFGWIVRGEARRRLADQVVKFFLPKQAANAADQIRRRLREIHGICGVLVRDAVDVLAEGGDVSRFVRAVDFAPDLRNRLDLVLLVDGGGNVVGYYPNPALDPKTKAARDALRPTSVAEQPWFRAITSGDQGEVWVDRHLSPFLHRTPGRKSRNPADYSLALAFSVPTDIAGVYGSVYALIRWQEVQKVLDETTRSLVEDAGLGSAEMFVCDADRTYLAHTRRQLYGERFGPDVLAAAVARAKRPGELAFTTASGERRWAGFAPVDADPALRWYVGLDASAAELFRPTREFSRNLLLVTAVIVLVLIAWAMFASRAVVRPVRRLAAATEAVARGDLTIRVPARGRHELADLGRAFNRMAGDLAGSREQLKQAERQAAWAEMARQVAHEIKNPLTPMRMSAQLLLKAKRDGDARLAELTDRLARTVLEQTAALDRIADEFRQFAGPPAQRRECLRADDLLADVEDHVAAMGGSGVDLEFAPGAGDALVEADRQEMRRVFLNLIHNALAACGERGRVEICSEAGEGVVIFRVADDGPGIQADARARLFEPYFTTKSSGTGLGLAISRRILHAHGGSIELDSSRPGRTVFRIELPRRG